MNPCRRGLRSWRRIRDNWNTARETITPELELPGAPGERLDAVLEKTTAARVVLDADLKGGEADVVLDEEGKLSVKRLRAAPREPAVDELAREISNELAVIDLPDLLIRLDRLCDFTRYLTHAGGAKPRRQDHARHLFAAIIAQACNLGTGRMARASDLSQASIGWTSEWYLGCR